MELNLNDKTPNLIEINERECIFFIPKIIIKITDINETRNALNKFFQYSLEQKFERIAIAIDFRDAVSFFNFKNEIKNLFFDSNIKISIYLNRIIEISKTEDIQYILETYHKSLLGGHVGMARMKNNIRKNYNWPSMTKDIREYISECQICEKSKIHTHTRTPMQISSTASEPFEKIFL